jgi:PAS domain S-box-containing protein
MSRDTRLESAFDTAAGGVRESGIPSGTTITLLVFAAGCVALGPVVGDDLPQLHLLLDTAMFALSGMLALLFWEVGRRLDRAFYKHLSIGFAAVAALEVLHAMVSVEWTGPLAVIARLSDDLRPLTWPPPAYLLPLGIGASLELLRRGVRNLAWFAIGVPGAALLLLVAFQNIAPYSSPALAGITRPSLIPVPFLWAGVAWICWRLRERDRAVPTLGLAALTVLVASIVMLYSRYPPDLPATIAHLGRLAAYVALLFSLLRLASLDMLELAHAETRLKRLNEELDARVQEQTAQLLSANERLTNEIAERRKSHEFLKAVTENTPAVIYVKDLEGRYLMINPRFAEIFQLDPASVIGKTDHDIFPEDAADAFRAMDQRVARADTALTEEELAPQTDGVHNYISVKAPLRDERGVPFAVFGISTDVTEVKRAREALAESEARARAIVENSLDAVIGMDGAGLVTDWSPQATATFGWTREEALGRPLGTLIVPEKYRAMHSSGLKRYLETGETRVLNRRTEIIGLHRDGREFPVELSITAIRAGGATTFSGFARDITERKAAEAKVQAQLERMALLDQVTRAIGERQDLGSIFQVAVGSVEDQLPADFVCICLYDRPDNALVVARVGAKSASFASATAISEQTRIEIDRNGLSRCVSGNLVYEPDAGRSGFSFPQRLNKAGLRSFVAAPLQVESQVFGALIVARAASEGFVSGECEFLRQLSEHVALAANQAELTAALQRAYDDLKRTQDSVMQQERLRALGQMASGIAHDINNALSPIALYTETILESEAGLSPSSRTKLEIVQRVVEDAAHTVSRMKDFYRQRESQLALAPVRVDTLLHQVRELTRSRWKDTPQQKGVEIEIETELPADLPPILGAESELREALVNLVFNAVDALPNGGVIKLRGKKLDGGRLLGVEVADDGVGMDQKTRERCLEPFFTTKGEAGSGLGLAMVYGVVKRHGGDLEIESAPGAGTTIRMTLAAAGEAEATSPQDIVAGPVARKRILVIDDDPILLRSLRDAIGSDGHVVEVAGDGAAGVEAFQAARQRGEGFDVVITDLGMPKMDGRRVAAAVKQLSPSTPVLLLTGWGERLMAEEERPPHVDRVLSKPPKLRDLREALASSGEGHEGGPPLY